MIVEGREGDMSDDTSRYNAFDAAIDELDTSALPPAPTITYWDGGEMVSHDMFAFFSELLIQTGKMPRRPIDGPEIDLGISVIL